MNILPKPKEIQTGSGSFFMEDGMKIAISEACPYEVVKYAFDITDEIYNKKNQKIGVTRVRINNFCIKVENNERLRREEYILEITPDNITLHACDKSGFFYAFKTLKQIILQYDTEIPAVYIHDFPDIEARGFYYDITRGKVPTMQTLKYLADKAAEYKLNQLQLYIEHTFAFRGMTEVWRGSDCLTAEDILEFDAYCRERNIELVPSFATFGHLYHLLTTNSFKEYCEVEDCVGKRYSWFDRQVRYTINPVNPDSIKLIKRIIDEVSPLFTSDKFNICCDETFDLGREKSKAEADKIGKGELYLKFMKQICECVRENGKKPMCWSDIILQHSELLEKLPEDVTYMNWGYSGPVNEEAVKTISKTGFDFYVCGGTSGWNRITNDIKLSEINLRTTAKAGFEYGAKGFLNTDWGDMGHINSLYTSIPGLIIGASYGWNTQSLLSYEEISSAEYGEDNTVKLLAELSDCEKFNWADLVSLREQEYGNGNDVLKCWINEEFDSQRSFEVLEKSYKKANEIKQGLKNIMYKSDKRKEYEAFVIAAEGVALFNALYSAVKVKMFNADTRLIMDMTELAEKLELWLYGYEKTWRESYRESELFRIRECVFYACDKLRNL